MQTLSEEGRGIVEALASRHKVSFEAARAVLFARAAGGGTPAQFNHPDLGGMGQWSQGVMVMIPWGRSPCARLMARWSRRCWCWGPSRWDWRMGCTSTPTPS